MAVEEVMRPGNSPGQGERVPLLGPGYRCLIITKDQERALLRAPGVIRRTVRKLSSDFHGPDAEA
jgi:hypothetical protein